MKYSISKIKCTQHRFDFNDGSMVTWTLMDINANQHGLFYVRIVAVDSAGNETSINKDERGPVSAEMSLHLLKLAIKQNLI